MCVGGGVYAAVFNPFAFIYNLCEGEKIPGYKPEIRLKSDEICSV